MKDNPHRISKKTRKRSYIGHCGVTGKMKFASKAKAKKDLRHYTGAEKKVCRVYRCEFCGKWHLTKSKKPNDA